MTHHRLGAVLMPIRDGGEVVTLCQELQTPYLEGRPDGLVHAHRQAESRWGRHKSHLNLAGCCGRWRLRMLHKWNE